MGIRSIALALAKESGRSAQVIEYGLKVGLYNTLGFFTVIGIGWLLGDLPVVLAAYVGSSSLRVVSGGQHLATPVSCILFSALVLSLAGIAGRAVGTVLTSVQAFVLLAAVLAWVLFLILRFAPRDVPHKPIGRQKAKRLRKWSVFVWLLWMGVTTASLAREAISPLLVAALFGLLVQGLSLLPNKIQRSSEAR